VSFGEMQRMMRQVQKMQADMQRVQEEAGQRSVEAAAGGGAVKAVCNGHGDLLSVTIDPAAVDPADVEMLQDLVVAAVNEAARKAREMMSQEMAKVTGGMRLPPGLPGFPG
jgi:DNA-binding YbaB/EbfC family protein